MCKCCWVCMLKCTRSGWSGLCVSLGQCSQAGKLEQLNSVTQKNSYRCTLAWWWVCQELKTENLSRNRQVPPPHLLRRLHTEGEGKFSHFLIKNIGLFELMSNLWFPPHPTSRALLICLCISFLFGTPFEWTDGFAHQMLSYCAVLHAVRLALDLAPFIREALFLWLCWLPS